MGRIALGLLVLGCLGLFVWAQVPQGQKAPEQAPAPEQKAAEPKAGAQNRPSEQPSGDASAPWTETMDYPLDKFKNFSAIMHGGPLPGIESDVHIYRSGNLMRMQGSHAVPNYYVTDLTKQKTHAVSAYTCLKMSNAYIRSFPFFVSAVSEKFEISPAGEETVDGHQCHVEDIKIHRPKRTEVPEFRLYEADDLQGFPIKIENHRKGAYHWVILYKDVRLEPQDPSLFIVPEKCDSDADFKKMTPGAKPKTAPGAKPKTEAPAKPQ